jgi:hypothetical protein
MIDTFTTEDCISQLIGVQIMLRTL